jgi:hypothetical protein
VVSGDQLALIVKAIIGSYRGDDLPTRLILLGKDLKSVSTYDYPSTRDAPPCVDRLIASGDILVTWSERVLCTIEKKAGKLELLWSKQITDQSPSPVVSGVLPLYDFGHEPRDTVIGLDARTGKELWTNEPPKNVHIPRTRISVIDGTLFSFGFLIQIIDPKTGKVTFEAKPTIKGRNYGGDEAVLAAGHIVMYRADGIWGFN